MTQANAAHIAGVLVNGEFIASRTAIELVVPFASTTSPEVEGAELDELWWVAAELDQGRRFVVGSSPAVLFKNWLFRYQTGVYAGSILKLPFASDVVRFMEQHALQESGIPYSGSTSDGGVSTRGTMAAAIVWHLNKYATKGSTFREAFDTAFHANLRRYSHISEKLSSQLRLFVSQETTKPQEIQKNPGGGKLSLCGRVFLPDSMQVNLQVPLGSSSVSAILDLNDPDTQKSWAKNQYLSELDRVWKVLAQLTRTSFSDPIDRAAFLELAERIIRSEGSTDR